jgi:hypothetical protein
MSYLNRDFYETTYVNDIWYKVEVFYINGDWVKVAIHKDHIGNIIYHEQVESENVQDIQSNVATFITLAIL